MEGQMTANMERAEFIRLASGLLGERWQTPLVEATGIAERSIRRIASGDRPVPERLSTALLHAHEVMNLIAELTTEPDAPDPINFSASSPGQLKRWVGALVVEALERQE